MITEKEYIHLMSIHKNEQLGYDTIDKSLCKSLAQKVLDKEQYILNLGPAKYNNTPPNVITGRHLYYNLLDFGWDELEPIKKKIIENSSKIIGGNEFCIKMWANVFRNGEGITKHTHQNEPIEIDQSFRNSIFKTLCGHLFLESDYPSETIYYFNKGTEPITNEVGDFHFFSMVVPHEVLPYKGKIRIGLAFDIYTSDFFDKLGIALPNDIRIIK